MLLLTKEKIIKGLKILVGLFSILILTEVIQLTLVIEQKHLTYFQKLKNFHGS